MRSVFFVLVGLAILAAPGSLNAAGEATAKPPNIVLVMADDLGWGDVGFNGNQVIRTPNLDALAAAGLKFNRFYAAAPVCSPTRGSALTGRHPFRYGVYSANVGHMKSEELTLAELLKQHGYTTGHFGKWHLGTLTTAIKDANRGRPGDAKHFSPPQANGFDVCFSTESKVPTWDPMRSPRSKPGKNFWSPVEGDENAVDYGTHYWNERGEVVQDNLRGDDSRIVMDRALPFITAAAKADRPFFAVIWFHAPHLPVVAGPQYTALYRTQSEYEQHYYGCITALDAQVGRLREALAKLNVADNTLLCFTSDNGPEGQAGKAPGSAGLFRGRKRDLYEGGVRVPAAIVWPARIKPHATTDVAASTVDYLPTILAALDVKVAAGRPLDGISLLPLFAGEMKVRPQPLGFRSGKQLAWHDGPHKLISTDNGRTFALYNLTNDPAETTDLSHEHSARVAEMQAALTAWVAACERSDQGADYR
jgi:arylsulfatase A-like enzyme